MSNETNPEKINPLIRIIDLITRSENCRVKPKSVHNLHLYQMVFRDSPEMIIVSNKKGDIILSSKMADQFVLLTEDRSLAGHKLFDFLDNESIDYAVNMLEYIFGSERQKFLSEFRFKRVDGVIKDIQVNADPIIDKHSNSGYVVIYFRDITEIKELERKRVFQEKFLQIIADISISQVNIPINQIEFSIQNSLNKIGEFVEADRFYIFDYSENHLKTTNLYEWCAPGINKQLHIFQNSPVLPVQEWIENHKNGRAVFISDVDTLEEGSSVKEILQPMKIKSLISIPIMDGEKCIGFTGFDWIKKLHTYSEEELSLLKIFAQLIVNVKKRVQAEKLLRESEEKYKALFEDSTDGYLLLHDGKFVECNSAAVKLLGASDKSYIIGKNPAQISPEFQPQNNESSVNSAAENISKALNDGKFQFEWTLLREDNREVTVSVNITPVVYENKSVLFSSCRDITELKEKEIQIKNQNLKLNAILEAVPDMIFITDINGNYIEVLRTNNKDFLHPAERIQGKNVTELFDHKIAKFHLNKNSECLQTQKKIYCEYVVYKNNRDYYYEATLAPLGQDKVLRFVRDITIRKEYEKKIQEFNTKLERLVINRTAKLEESNINFKKEIVNRKQIELILKAKSDELEKIFQVSPDIMCVAKNNGKFVKINKAWELLLGYKLDELLNLNFFDIVHPDDKKITFLMISKLMVSDASDGFVNRIRSKSGEFRVFEWNCVQIEDQFLAAARDVTAKLNLHNQMELSIAREKELNELKSRFVSMASHEFRTPLSAILISAESLISYWEKMTGKMIESKLLNMKNQVLHLNKVVSNVMMVSKIQEGKIELNIKEIDVLKMFTEVVAEFDVNLRTNSSIIKVNTDFSILIMNLDERLLIQILQNLISNAIKYSQPEPKIEMTLKLENEFVFLSIEDNGIGVPESEIANLYQPFFRASNVQNIEGNGLGLNIVKQSVELLGGKIEYESKVGSGATFIVKFPSDSLVSFETNK